MAHFGADLNLGGGTNIQTPPANDKAASKFTLDFDGVVDAIWIFYQTFNPGKSKAIIYDSTGAGGLPGAFVAQSAEVVTAGTTGTAIQYTFSPGVSLTAAGGPYWIGIWSDTTSTSSCQTLSTGIAFNSNTYSTGGSPTDPFGSSPSTTGFFYPIIARYTPTALAAGTYSGELVGMDDTSLAQYPNNNIGVIQLDRSYSSGSSISSITFFLAAAYPSAKVKVVVYANDGAAGAPGTLLGASSEVTGQALGVNTISFASPVSFTGNPYIGVFTDTDLHVYRHVDAGRANYDGTATYGSAPGSFPGSPTPSTNQPPLWANGTFVTDDPSPNYPHVKRPIPKRRYKDVNVTQSEALPEPVSRSPFVLRRYNRLQDRLAHRFNSHVDSAITTDQSLDPSLYINSNAFFSPTVTETDAVINNYYVRRPVARRIHRETSVAGSMLSSQELDPSIFINDNPFYQPTVTISDTLGRALLRHLRSRSHRRPRFHSTAGTISLDQTLNPSLYVNNNSFFVSVVVEDLPSPNVVQKRKRFVQRHTNFSVSAPVLVTAQTLSAPLYFDFDTFYPPVIVTPLTGRTSLSLATISTLEHSGSFGFLSGRTSLQLTTTSGPLDGLVRPSEITTEDPLWIALEVDLLAATSDSVLPGIGISQSELTLRLGNKGSLQRVVDGVRYAYSPRLITDITIGTSISISTGSTATPFYQQPLRGQPNGGTISWIIDPNSTEWFGSIHGTQYIGATFRLYTGHTFDDANADVDNDLVLVYTGHVVDFAIDVTARPPTATIQTTDASSNLDRSLVDDLYSTSFPITSLQGKPRPQLIGRKFSIAPILEDQASLTYRVTRIEPGVIDLGDVTQLTVGGVPWRRASPSGSAFSVDLTPTVDNVNAQYAALPADLKLDFDLAVLDHPDQYNTGNGLQNEANIVGLLTLYGGLSGVDRADFDSFVGANPSLQNDPTSTLLKIGLIKSRYFGLRQGEWAADIPNGTVQLGSDPGSSDVRVDAQTTDWETMDIAALITKICTMKGIALNVASMAQLHLDWSSLIGYYTDTNDVNCLNALDEITSGELCEWDLDETGAVEARIFDAPDVTPDLLFVATEPNVPLDGYLLPSPGAEARDPVPKMINTIAQTGVLSPAYRARIGYAGRASPSSSFLDGVTVEEQKNLSAPELVADWIPGSDPGGDAGFQLSPSDGTSIRLLFPRAQDVYLSSLSNTLVDAYALRIRLVQRVIGFLNHQLWSVTVRMDPSQVKLMSSVQMVWMDENGQDRIVYSGSFRVTSAIMVLGGGAQQLELWGTSTTTSYKKPLEFTDTPPSGPLIDISFTPFEVKV